MGARRILPSFTGLLPSVAPCPSRGLVSISSRSDRSCALRALFYPYAFAMQTTR